MAFRTVLSGLIFLLISMYPTVSLAKDKASPQKLDAKLFDGLALRGIGPALMSGRISDVVIHPKKKSIRYLAVGSGGVWKTENAGTTWTSIFDDQPSFSIGCITLDPQDPETIWIGTGENVGGRHVAFGDGVYRSTDGGVSWKRMGLKKSQHIAKIIIHPDDSNIIYVACQGPLWSAGGDRGLFKSTDAGTTWTKILGGGPYTGVNDAVMHPKNPNILYAATHQRLRNVAVLVNGGPETGIHKTTDGGKTWTALKKGLPSEDMGSIGLAISPQYPDVVYATIELAHRKGGFFRSDNGGGSWEKRNSYLSGGTGPHYYQELFACPHKFDRVYQMDVRIHVTEDGGQTFKQVPEPFKHSDNHALAFDPDDPSYLMAGTDGGLYETWDLGKNWQFTANLPITQFYKVAVDNDLPFYNVYGGTQDNNSQGGPSRTDNVSGIRNSDWFITLFGDGHQSATDPSNPNIIYAQWQQGNLVRFDRQNGEIVYIQPQPKPGEPAERWNWDSPVLVSPHNPKTLYFASQRIWRTDNRGDSWEPISGDLSRNGERLFEPIMGRIHSFDSVWDLWAMSNYGNITSLSESPLVEGLLYAGTDDGLLQISPDAGKSWRKVEVTALPGVPKEAFINDIKADLHHPDTVYVALDNHKHGDFTPYLLKSNDRGQTWASIAGDLPPRHLVWRIVQDPIKPELYYLGTEFGLFFSMNGGKNWIELTGNAPNISFRDLVIQTREDDLVGATFGRGFYILDHIAPLREFKDSHLSEEAHLYSVRDTWWYVQKRPLGRSAKASQGASFFTAPNPPFGAVFTYFVSEDMLNQRQARLKREGELKKEGKDTPHPGWDQLQAEELENSPCIILTVKDSEGRLVRQLEGPATKGFHRVAWDLTRPSASAWTEKKSQSFWRAPSWLAPPGTYHVSLSKRHDGTLVDLEQSQQFEVKPLERSTLKGQALDQVTAFYETMRQMDRRVSAAQEVYKQLNHRIGAIKAVLDSNHCPESLTLSLKNLRVSLSNLNNRLNGHALKRKIGEPVYPGIQQRMFYLNMGNQYSTYGPTPDHLAALGYVQQEMKEISEELELIQTVHLPSLEKEMEANQLPWTPGRVVP